jgi:hypothetical protein
MYEKIALKLLWSSAPILFPPMRVALLATMKLDQDDGL